MSPRAVIVVTDADKRTMSVAIHQNVDNVIVKVVEECTAKLTEHPIRLSAAKRLQGNKTPIVLRNLAQHHGVAVASDP